MAYGVNAWRVGRYIWYREGTDGRVGTQPVAPRCSTNLPNITLY